MGDRCTGHCCKHFFLPLTPEELATTLHRLRRREDWEMVNYRRRVDAVDLHDRETWRTDLSTNPLPAELEGPNYDLREIEKIAEMAVYLGTTHPRLGEMDRGGIYTCRHLSSDGQCTIYTTRPDICRHYPYGNKCEWGDDCHWDAARDGTTTDLRRAIYGRSEDVAVRLNVLQGAGLIRAESST